MHTRGPWYIGSVGNRWQIISNRVDNERPCLLIAQVCIPEQGSPISLAEATANVQLMAASPWLLAALQDALADYEDTHGKPDGYYADQHWSHAARLAIDLATGRKERPADAC